MLKQLMFCRGLHITVCAVGIVLICVGKVKKKSSLQALGSLISATGICMMLV